MVRLKQSGTISNMSFLKKYKIEIIAFVLIIFCYFSFRFYNLMSLPIFTDEAIYVRWSQIARFDPSWRFISLTDGKQPMFVWITTVIMRLVKDPLMAGRLVSVGAGFLTLIGLFFLGKEVFKKAWVGIVASFMYLIFPMALVYDRMALYDSLVGVFTVWALYFEVLLIRYLRLDIALILGMIVGAGVLNKTSAFFSIYLLPFSLVLFDSKHNGGRQRFFKWIALAGVVVVLTYAYYSVLRLSPFFHIVNDKNAIFVYPLKEWLTHPFNFLPGNLKGLSDWFFGYITLPVLALMTLSLFIERDKTKEKILLIAWFAVPFFALAFFGRVLYPRFIFFMTLSLLPLASFALVELFSSLKNKKFVFATLTVLIFILALRSDYFILTNFSAAPIPRADLGQYINGWPAGGGIKEIISFLEQRAKKGKIYVASEGTFGSLPTYSVEIYLGENKNIDKRGIWPLPNEIPSDLVEKSKIMPVYFIFYQTKDIPSAWPLRLINKYQKGTSDWYTSLYQVNNK